MNDEPFDIDEIAYGRHFPTPVRIDRRAWPVGYGRAGRARTLRGASGPHRVGGCYGDVENISASEGLFRSAIAALLIVTFLDIVVAWALYVVLRPVNATLAILVGWLRLAAPAVFAMALANLLDVAQLVGDAGSSALAPEQLGAQVMASIASFDNGWAMSLAIFGLHLVGLGYLLFKSANFPRFLGVLVVIAGGGYLADTFTRILVPDFEFTFSVFTFVGEALLIVWLIMRAIKGFVPEQEGSGGQVGTPPLA